MSVFTKLGKLILGTNNVGPEYVVCGTVYDCGGCYPDPSGNGDWCMPCCDFYGNSCGSVCDVIYCPVCQ